MSTNKITTLLSELKQLGSPEKVTLVQKYFKTGKGEYAEGDIFWGISVPHIRKIAWDYHKELNINDLEKLLEHKIHEIRLCALLIMNFKAKQEPEPMYSLYLQKTRFINNWDLVDLSAPTIIGEYLMHKDPIILYTLARSLSLWERRIAIVSTHAFIKEGKAQYTLELSEILMNDTQDLIHKAVGWMLREVGKRCSLTILEKFLNKHAPTMPRTMLRYAIEHLSPEKKKLYMHARKTNKFISLA